MPYLRPPVVGPLFVVPLFVLCASCGYLTIEAAPDHCKQPLDHHPTAVYLDTRALDELWDALGDGLADEGLGRRFDGGA